MEGPTYSYYLIIAGVVALVIEVLIGAADGFELLVLGIIAIIAGGLGMLTGSFMFASIIGILLVFLYIFIGRKFIKSKVDISTIATNIDSLIGEDADVVKPITRKKAGQVSLNGELWRATSTQTLKKGEDVIVESISGVTLKVVRKPKKVMKSTKRTSARKK